MDHREAGYYWNRNADAWTRLARAGWDVYRNSFNTPAFFEMLPDVDGLSGLDVGCGEGYNTRRLARRGAKVTAVDISPVFVEHALATELTEPLGIRYAVASAVELPFPDGSFDFAVGFMSLMDVPETALVLAEIYRVLKPGGFLQFSITHPCFDTPHRKNLRNELGVSYAIEVGEYFREMEGEIRQWTFYDAPKEIREAEGLFSIPMFHRTLSWWLNSLVKAGFTVERVEEPSPSDAVVSEYPTVQDAQVVAYFLHVRVRKGG